MKKIFLLFLLAVACIQVQAQKETYNWAFGINAGLSWNSPQTLALTGQLGTANATLSGLPTSISTSINTIEGCFSLSNVNGDLLFYSDGVTVWDKNNNPMPNGTGLSGSFSAPQSGVIFPYPGHPNQYVAVCVGAEASNVLAYSVIDMTLNGGLGDVVTTQKNIPLTGASGTLGESVTSIRHANGTDFWVVAPGRGSSGSFLNAWLITGGTVNTTTPIMTSTAPNIINGTVVSGYIKFTADGKHFVWTTFSNNRILYGDFNSTVGAFSNIKAITTVPQPYGVEFSKSTNFLYIGSSNTILYVIDFNALLAASNPDAVPRKTYNLVDSWATPQLGPDGRMYINAYGQKYLYLIDDPEMYNNPQIYRLPANFLSGTPQAGLPSFSASWFSASTAAKPFQCTGNDLKLTIELVAGSDTPATLEWNFDDGTPIVSQPYVVGTTTYQQTHNYALAGGYNVVVTPHRSNGTAMPIITFYVNVVDCILQSNRMIRVNLLNSAQQQ